MKKAKAYDKDIFCLEGDWNKNLLKQNSVKAALDFLKENRDIEYIHRHCGTRENLAFYLDLVKVAREHIIAGDFYEWKEQIIPQLKQRL